MRKALVFLAIAAMLLGFSYLALAAAEAPATGIGGPPGPGAPPVTAPGAPATGTPGPEGGAKAPVAPAAQPPGPTAAPPATGPRMMTDDVYTPLSQGYDLFRDGKYDAAEAQFKAALKADRYNPFALNNLAALYERQGKMQDAMAFLTDAQTHAGEYKDKLQQTCFPGGLCAAVKPVKEVGPASMIATVVAENMAKLKEKMGKKK